MNLAILEVDPLQYDVYSDVFCEFYPKMHSDFDSLKTGFRDQYDIIILPHRIGDLSWKDIYCDLNSTRAKYIVTATYNDQEYKFSEPSIYRQLKDARTIKNVRLQLKSDYRQMYEILDLKKSFLGIKYHAMNLSLA